MNRSEEPRPAPVVGSRVSQLGIALPVAKGPEPGTPEGNAAREAERHAATLAALDGEEPLDLLEAVELLRGELGALRLPLEVPEVSPGRREREDLIAHLDDYLLPRLRRMDAPVLAVVGGSTGAGKSTLVNSLVRREVTRSGVLRPTTRSPVLVHHPYDSGAFLSQRILPGLARVTSEAPEPAQPVDLDAPRVTALRLVPHEGMPSGIAIVDAPDIDSLVEANRDLAMQLLAAADLWLFVTTAARYADQVPWEMLKQSVDRGVAVAVVLDRVPPEAMQTVRMHLATMLRDRGLGTSPMFTIPESPRSAEGFLPKEVVEPLLGWLARIARDSRSRDVVIRRTLVGALDSLRARVPLIATCADEQVAADERLRDDLDEVYATAGERLEQRLTDGTALRGEVLARWQEFVGTGDLVRSLDATVNRLRDRLSGANRHEQDAAQRLDDAIQLGVHALIRNAAQAASDEAVLAWRTRDEGAALLASAGIAAAGQQRLSPDFDARVVQAVHDWQAEVCDLVGQEGDPRRGGVSGPGLVLMLAVLCQSAGVTQDPRVSASAVNQTAAHTAAISQRVLKAMFGDDATRSLTSKVRGGLLTRAVSLLDGERSRVENLLDAAGVRDGRGETLRALSVAIEGAR